MSYQCSADSCNREREREGGRHGEGKDGRGSPCFKGSVVKIHTRISCVSQRLMMSL